MKSTIIFIVIFLLIVSYQPTVFSETTGKEISDIFYNLTVLWNGTHSEDETVTPFVMFVSYCFSAIVTISMFIFMVPLSILYLFIETIISLMKIPFTTIYNCFCIN